MPMQAVDYRQSNPQKHILSGISSALVKRLKVPVPEPVAHWILSGDEISDIWRRAQGIEGGNVFSRFLDALGIRLELDTADLRHIPRTGPVLIAANHPHGLLDGLVLGAILCQVRPEFRILANSLLHAVSDIAPFILPVDPFGGGRNVHENGRSLRAAFRLLKQGGALVVFPAGEVSTFQPHLRGIADPAWSSGLFELAFRTNAPVVPVFLHGHNGLGFHVAGMVHPMLRTALLGRELVNKRMRRIAVSIGRRIPAERLHGQGGVEQAAAYVRQRTYALGHRLPEPAAPSDNGLRSRPLAQASLPERMEREIAALPATSLLYERGDFSVLLAAAAEIPTCLHEIGRLREATFRAAGEGTGRDLDLDRFDRYYQHLFLWNHAAREIVGAYRLGDVAAIAARQGVSGFYTHTLFRYDESFIKGLAPGIELGRSFIRAEYQRRSHSLSYLWKGIGGLLARRPQTRFLFGPVSISADYSAVAQELIVAYFEARRDPETGEFVKPRSALKRRLKPADSIHAMARKIQSIGELSELIADLQADGREIPVLLRHYLNLGGEVLGFNVDREFSNVLDALVIVDLAKSEPAVLKRYTGYSRPA